MSAPDGGFTVDTPCPRCGQHTLMGYKLVNEAGEHMHTRYVCRFWPSSSMPGTIAKRCRWEGWSVPEPPLTTQDQTPRHTVRKGRVVWGDGDPNEPRVYVSDVPPLTLHVDPPLSDPGYCTTADTQNMVVGTPCLRCNHHVLAHYPHHDDGVFYPTQRWDCATCQVIEVVAEMHAAIKDRTL